MRICKILLFAMLIPSVSTAQMAIGSRVPVPPFTISKVSAGTAAIDLTDTALASIYWFNAYRAADFPEVTTGGATYFAIYATDHDAGQGAINWGTFSSLDLSDFAEQGEVWDGNDAGSGYSQTETPQLVREPNDANGRTLYLYYHSIDENDTGQVTMLITSAGGDLDAITWTDEGEVLPQPTGTYGSDAHTGYAIVERLSSSSWQAFSLYRGGASSRYAYWTSSDGKSWTLQNDELYATRNPPGKGSVGHPKHITYRGKRWGLSSAQDSGTSANGTIYAGDHDDLDLPIQGPFYPLATAGTGDESEQLRSVGILLGADGLPFNDSGTYHLYYITSDSGANNGGNKLFYATLTLQ